jgi:hypothetical protein
MFSGIVNPMRHWEIEWWNDSYLHCLIWQYWSDPYAEIHMCDSHYGYRVYFDRPSPVAEEALLQNGWHRYYNHECYVCQDLAVVAKTFELLNLKMPEWNATYTCPDEKCRFIVTSSEPVKKCPNCDGQLKTKFNNNYLVYWHDLTYCI